MSDPRRGKRKASPPSTGNRLLDALIRERPSLLAHCERLRLAAGAELCGEGRPATHLWFPIDGLASVVIHLADGCTSHVAAIGNEGFVGAPAWLGLPRALETVVQQRSGDVIRVPRRVFDRAASANRASRDLLQHFVCYVMRFGWQTAACNACHSVEERVCRWLLTAADRTPHGNTFGMSQVMLADALGVRRQTIGEIAVRLKSDGLIAYRRGSIGVVERAALERRACECYGSLRDVFRELIEPLLA